MDNRRRARLIVRRLERYPHAALWGFPIPFKQMMATLRKTVPPNINEKELVDLVSVHSSKLLSRLQSKCNQIWFSAANGPEDVYARNDRYGEKPIFALVKSTRRDDTFVPPPEKVAELKKIFAEEGFTDEPGWFIAVD